MNQRRPSPRETDVLSEPAATQLLARASELDAALKGGTSIANLRAAAAEAGISSTAFDAALVEARAEGQADVAAAARRPPRFWPWLAGASLVVLGMATIVVQRSAIPAGMIELPMLVRCIRAKPAQLEKIRSVLEQAERASTTCVSR